MIKTVIFGMDGVLIDRVPENGVKRKTGARDVLDYLKANQIRTAVAVSGGEEDAVNCLEEAGLREKLDDLICASEAESGLADFNLYRYACGRMGVKAEECAAVGAFSAGLADAGAAGLVTVLVPDPMKPKRDEAGTARVQIDTLYDIILMLEDGII